MRRKLDAYYTPSIATQTLLKYCNINGIILESCTCAWMVWYKDKNKRKKGIIIDSSKSF